jgi:hypothetical protein
VDGSTTVPYGAATLAVRLADSDDPVTARLAGHELVFELTGASYRATTDAGGLARVTAPALIPPGTYSLTVRFEGDNLYLPSQVTATLNVSTGTPGHVTGGGLRSSANGRGGFNVHSDGRQVKGQLEYQSPTAGNFHAGTMTALGVAPDGRSAWFTGIGEDGRSFLAYVEDRGEPSTGDIWRLWIAGRLETDGPVSGGNIQIHRGP